MTKGFHLQANHYLNHLSLVIPQNHQAIICWIYCHHCLQVQTVQALTATRLIDNPEKREKKKKEKQQKQKNKTNTTDK